MISTRYARLWRRAGLGLLCLFWAVAVQAGVSSDIFRDGFEPVESADEKAARFLDQATFGGRLEDIAHLRQIGTEAWLTEQFAAPISLTQPYLDWVSQTEGVYWQARIEAWFMHAAQLADPREPTHEHRDQLRQRVAFALSQIMVVSDRNANLELQQWAMGSYQDLLARNAFGNFRTLLEEVTLHPAMGKYLSMLGNRKFNAALNIRPDENYAREILQLFSVGLVRLNPDGTVQDGDPNTAGVQPIPTYDQNVVRGFAHVFTGWNFLNCSQAEFEANEDCAPGNPYEEEWFSPMVPFEALHDNTTAKQLLNYPGVTLPNGVLAAGGNATQELDAALDNIFNHPNVGPFIGKQLIQRLVTSNPSPAYVGRVAAVFNNNGQGVRGDLRAVVRAILIDDEARNGHVGSTTFGKLREPALHLVRLFRVTDARSVNGRVFLYSHPDEEYGQRPLSAPSVFNFYKPDFAAPGEIRNAGLVSPEFQIATDTHLVSVPNELDFRLFVYYVGSACSIAQDPEETLMDYGPLRVLAANPASLVDHLDLVMMSGSMSSAMRELLITRLNGTVPDSVSCAPAGLTAAQRRDLWRVQQALYLITNSPEFNIQK